MAAKIYLSGGAINIEGIQTDLLSINPTNFDWQKISSKYFVRDKIENQSYELGIYSNIQDYDGVAFGSDSDVIVYLNNLVNAPNSEIAGNTNNQDITGNQALVSTFGDAVVSTRVPSITAQFMYGLLTGNTNPYEDDAIITNANGGTTTISDGELILSSGVNAAGSTKIQSNDYVRYVPGFEMYVLFTAIFTTPAINSNQYVGLYDDNDGFFVGYKGTDFVFVRRKDGNDDVHILDPVKIGFNPLKFNIFNIRYGFLGVAPIKLSVIKPGGGFKVAHVIEYPNNFDTIHTSQTFLPLRGEAINSGSGTDKIIKIGSVAAGVVDGNGFYPSTRYITNSNSLSVTAGTTLLALYRNKLTYAGIANRVRALLLNFSAATEGTKTVKIVIKRNPTITNTPTWANVDTAKSTFEFSTNGTINTATGRVMAAFNLSKSGQIDKYLRELNIYLRPGEWASIEIITTGSSDVDVSLRWEEQF